MSDEAIDVLADHPDVTAYLATLPLDPGRDQLAAEYRAAAEALAEIRARVAELQARRAALAETPPADTEAWTARSRERMAITLDLKGLADEVGEPARRFARALGAWVDHVYDHAEGETRSRWQSRALAAMQVIEREGLRQLGLTMRSAPKNVVDQFVERERQRTMQGDSTPAHNDSTSP